MLRCKDAKKKVQGAGIKSFQWGRGGAVQDVLLARVPKIEVIAEMQHHRGREREKEMRCENIGLEPN